MPSLSGLSGFDAEAVLSQLMGVERIPLNRLAARKKTEESRLTTLQSSRSFVNTVRLAALELKKAALWQPVSSTSSSTAAKVTLGASPVSASASFTIDSLATRRELVSNATYASLSSTASTSTSRSTTLSESAGTLGLTSVTATRGLTDGTYVIESTASSASTLIGAALEAATTIDETNDTFTITNGYGTDSVTATLTIAHGTYTTEELLDAVNTALGTAAVDPTAEYVTARDAGQRPVGIGVTASLVGGALVFTSDYHGPASTLSIDGGTARGALALGDGQTMASAGSVGSLSVNGTAIDLSTILVPGTMLSAEAGELTLSLGESGLTAASTTLSVTTTAGAARTLQQLIDDINDTTDYTASAVSDGAGGYRLRVVAAATGAAATLDLSAFTIDGGTNITQVGTDAQVTLTGGAVKTSSTNVLTDVLTGSAITVSALSATAVDVSVTIGTANVDTIAGRLSGLVNALNASLSDINRQTGYDPVSGKSGDLSRELGLRRIASDMRQALLSAGISPSTYGITVDRTGLFSFDRTKLDTAMAENPEAVRDALVGTDGLITKLASVTATAAYGPNSILNSAEDNRRNLIRRFGNDITSLTSRLEKRETTLRAQFTQLDMSLRRLQGQQQWLTNQVNSLNSSKN